MKAAQIREAMKLAIMELITANLAGYSSQQKSSLNNFRNATLSLMANDFKNKGTVNTGDENFYESAKLGADDGISEIFNSL